MKPPCQVSWTSTIIVNSMTFPHQNGGYLSEKYPFLIVNYKKTAGF